MGSYTREEIDAYTEKAKTAKENLLAAAKALEGRPAAFLILCCLIDFLGGLYAGSESSGKTYKDFVGQFMPGYDPDALRDSLRNKLVHNYTVKDQMYVLVWRQPSRHKMPAPIMAVFSSQSSTQSLPTYLNLESFMEDVERAAEEYFGAIQGDSAREENLASRIERLGIVEEVPLSDAHGPVISASTTSIPTT